MTPAPWLHGKAWKRFRQKHLEQNPICELCADHEIIVEASAVKRLGLFRTEAEFWAGPFVSTCNRDHLALSRRRARAAQRQRGIL